MDQDFNAAGGFIDLHSHLLPGIDDGCISVDDSLACIRRLQRHGFVGSVCTPHYWMDEFPDNTPAEIARRVEILAEQIAEAGIEYRIWAGAEVRIAPYTIPWMERTGVPTLGESRYVLIDFWGYRWPAFGDQVVDFLLDHDFRPILAHPERMGLDDLDLEAVVSDLLDKGVLLQGNLNSISGGEGSQARTRTEQFLTKARYHLIASDTHRPTDLDGRMDGIGILERHVGTSAASTLLDRKPREILLGTK